MSPEQEGALVLAAQNGDADAIGALMKAHQRHAFGIAYHLLRNADWANEAVQDGFCKLYQRIGQFRGGPFRPWLNRIIINTCYDRLRVERRWQARLIDGDEYAAERGYRLRAAAPTPDQQAELAELRADIMRAIGGLPEHQRRVVVLCDVGGLSYDEAAQTVGVRIGTVKSRLHRARMALRRELRED